MKEAKAIDQLNGNKLWEEAVVMGMTNNRFAFDHYKDNTSDFVAYDEITGPFIFDVKLSEKFRIKARFVFDGHLVKTPASITYSTVASRDSVIILLLVAALYYLETMGADL